MNHDCTDRTKIAGEARLRLSFFLLLTACATPFLFQRINEWFLHTGLIYLIPILMITNVMFTPHLIVNLEKMNEFSLMLGLGNVHSSIQVIPDIARTYLQTPLPLPEFFPIGQWNRFK